MEFQTDRVIDWWIKNAFLFLVDGSESLWGAVFWCAWVFEKEVLCVHLLHSELWCCVMLLQRRPYIWVGWGAGKEINWDGKCWIIESHWFSNNSQMQELLTNPVARSTYILWCRDGIMDSPTVMEYASHAVQSSLPFHPLVFFCIKPSVTDACIETGIIEYYFRMYVSLVLCSSALSLCLSASLSPVTPSFSCCHLYIYES